MKKNFYVLFIGILVYSSFLVKTAQAVVPAPISMQDMELMTATGKVESISRECSTKGTLAMVVLVDKDGKRVIVEVRADTVIYDEDGEIIAMDKVQKDDKVTIEYREMKRTIEKAESIKLTK